MHSKLLIKPSKLALLPLLTFLVVFLGFGFYFQSQGMDYAFYQMPASVAVLPAALLAVLLSRSSINHAIEQFVIGAGHNNIITMVLIYLFAGAFSALAKATGSVDATISLGLYLLPEQFILPGLFIIAAFVATAMGTSMGTLAALAPIGVGVAQQTGLSAELVAGTLVGGAIFGDNLSIISDTTIAATRTQGCSMKDKLKQNSLVAVPAGLIVVIFLSLLTPPTQIDPVTSFNAWMVLPYLLILALAIAGINVFVVLWMGIIACLSLGMVTQGYPVSQLGTDITAGFSQMQELIILAILLGGISELMKQQGGLAFIVNGIGGLLKRVSLAKTAVYELAIGLLAAITNIFMANNTVAIIVCGDTAKALATEANVKPARAASMLDIFACIMQGLLPHGGQLLLVAASFSLSPLSIVSQVYYCYVLAVVAVISLLIPRKLLSKNH